MFFLARFRTLAEVGRSYAIERVVAPSPYEMRAYLFKRGLLGIISDCMVDPWAAILAVARAGKIDWTAPDCLGSFFYDFVDATIVFVPEWHAKVSNGGPVKTRFLRLYTRRWFFIILTSSNMPE